MPNEWSSLDPQAVLPIPPELVAEQRYRFAIQGSINLAGTCADFEVLLTGVTLKRCLVDTSERVQAVTLRKRVTFRSELTVVGVALLVFPLDGEEVR